MAEIGQLCGHGLPETRYNLPIVPIRRMSQSRLKKDPLMAFKYIVPAAMVVALAGCGSVGAIGVPWKRERPPVQAQLEPLPSTATTPVQSSDLGPPGGDPMIGDYGSDGTDIAMTQPLAPPAGTTAPVMGSGVNGGLGRTDLLGGWTITSGGDSCQLFMTLTSWTGGYRASTRGCTNTTLKSIQAWNLRGSQVILAGQGGSPLATLASAGSNRFDGQANGQSVSFYR